MNIAENRITQIRKRDGRIVDFDQGKITEAIWHAAQSVGGKDKETAIKLSDIVIDRLSEKFHSRSIPAVEEIQDMVEKVLVENGHVKTVRAFILYREQHARMRDFRSLVDSDELMEGYLQKLDWRVNENANMSYSLQGLNNYVAAAISSNYWLNKVYPKEVREAHVNADMHIHDLQLLSAYCCGWDLKDLLVRGFGGVVSKIESRPPKHFRTALGQVTNFFYTLQGETAGAQAFSNFDTLLAPFIKYDKLSFEDVKQCLQEFLFNMNVPTRVGFQTPFTNITMDLVVPSTFTDEAVIINGIPQKETYKEFQNELDMFNKAFAELMMEGDAKGRVFSFPIPTYNISKDFSWNGPVVDTIMEMTAKYGIPYFANFVNSDMRPEDARSMCCRLRLDNRELRKRGGGLFGANPLTGSIGVVTINMPRLGYSSKTKTEFFEKLENLMVIARKSLEIKREILEKFTDSGLYPYSKHYLANVKKRFGAYWKNHFNTIGLLGVNEASLNLIGKNIIDPEGHAFAGEILDFMREKLMDYQNETNNLFNLEATPGEGTSYRFARKDKELYPDIICANEEAVRNNNSDPYYTNSTHLPVDFTDDLFEALRLQDDLQCKYTGGTVLHGFLGERMPSIESTKTLIKKIAESFRLPYYTITPTFSICPKHGYLSGEHEFCPVCDDEMGYEEEKLENAAT